MDKDDTPDERESYRNADDVITVYSQVGKLVRAERVKRGWSQADLAERADLNQKTVSNVENATIEANSQTLQQLFEALGLAPYEINELPPVHFEPYTNGFRLKMSILGGYIFGRFPEGTCARHFANTQWRNEVYHHTARVPDVEEAVWRSLASDGYFEVDEQGRYLVLNKPVYSFGEFIGLYVSTIPLVFLHLSKVGGTRRSKLLANLGAARKTWLGLVDNTEGAIDAFRQYFYVMASIDRLYAPVILGYFDAFRLVLELFASQFLATRGADDRFLAMSRSLLHSVSRTQDFAFETPRPIDPMVLEHFTLSLTQEMNSILAGEG